MLQFLTYNIVPCYDIAAILTAILNAGYKGLICGLDELLEQADAD